MDFLYNTDMKEDPRDFWDNIPREVNRYFGDEVDEFDKPGPKPTNDIAKVEREFGD